MGLAQECFGKRVLALLQLHHFAAADRTTFSVDHSHRKLLNKAFWPSQDTYSATRGKGASQIPTECG